MVMVVVYTLVIDGKTYSVDVVPKEHPLFGGTKKFVTITVDGELYMAGFFKDLNIQAVLNNLAQQFIQQ